MTGAFVFFISGFLCGGDLAVSERNKSDYQVVIPDDSTDKQLDRFIKEEGELLCKCVKQASGAALPLVKESAMDKSKPSIFVGNTKALAAAGIKSADLKTWEHGIFTKNKNIYLFGQDWNSPVKHYTFYQYFILGSYKAVAVFLEKFVATRFLFPGEEGTITLKLDRIRVPDNFKYRKIPTIQYCIAPVDSASYNIANNFFRPPWYRTYGGHSHPVAVPKDKYLKSNPEYFALSKGERSGFSYTSHAQYCISNPKVQELIYQKVLEECDKKYDVVQLAQADGFRPCECEECAKLYGVKSFGEKLWIMHRDMALRLQKDRPGKKVCIIAYGPTKSPPETFKDFPGNVIIELAPYSEEVLKTWKDYKIPGGFVVYLYNWGYYQAEGLTPKRTPEFLETQAKSFNENNVKGIYCCGFGELFGLEGPEYYMWGKQLENPSLSSSVLLDEYCNYAFGPAAKTMRKFYDSLYTRMNFAEDKESDWNNHELLDGKLLSMSRNCRILLLRYPPEIIDTLDKILSEAEKQAKGYPPADNLMPLVRLEFDYLKLTSNAVNKFDEYRKNPSPSGLDTVIKAVDARNKFIARLPLLPGSKIPSIGKYKSISLFRSLPLEMMLDNGRLNARLPSPFNWDAQWMLENKIIPAGRKITASPSVSPEPEPQYLIQYNLSRPNPALKEKPILVKCSWDDKDLYADFICRNTTEDAINNDKFQIYLVDLTAIRKN